MQRLIPALLLALVLAGCSGMTASTPLSAAPGRFDTIQVVKQVPAKLPSGTHTFPGLQYVLIPQDSAMTLLVPVPFVGEAVMSALADADAKGAAARYGAVDPYEETLAATASRPLFGLAASPAKLYPFVFVNEGHDARYRLSLVYQVEDGDWLGRYFYHLPSTLPLDALKAPTPQIQQTLRSELAEGTRTLADLVERDRNGTLGPTGRKAKIGSLYLVGGNIAGLIAPEMVHYPDAEILEEQGDHIVLRHDGMPTAAGQSGALLFGVHHFLRSQLHFFEVRP